MSLEDWNPRTQPLRAPISRKRATFRLPTTTTTSHKVEPTTIKTPYKVEPITKTPYKVEKMARAKEVSARIQKKRDQKTEITNAPTPPPAPPKKTTAKQPQVNRDYEFADGDDQMWHATWCLDSWNKPGSKTLLLFQWDCQDEPTWEPLEGHNEDSCLAADFFHWLPDRPRPAGWKPPVGWQAPETRPPRAWFEAEEEARRRFSHLWADKTLQAKLKSLEPLHCQIKLGSHARSSSAKIKINGAKKLVRDSRRSGSYSSLDLDSECSPITARTPRPKRRND